MKNKIHNHPGMESNFNIDKDHIIIDKPDFEKANKAIEFAEKIAKFETGSAPSVGYFQELIEEAQSIFLTMDI